MSNTESHTYELTIPGLDFKVTGTSTIDLDTQHMTARFEVPGGGSVTVDFPDDHETTIRTDMLCQSLYLALRAQTVRIAQSIITEATFQNIVKGLEEESE